MVAQYVFNFPRGPAQQLFNDGAALQNETKRYAPFYLCHVTASHIKYSFLLAESSFIQPCDLFFIFSAPGMRNALLVDRTAATLLWPDGNLPAMFSSVLISEMPLTLFRTLSFYYAIIGFSHLINL